MGRKKRKKQSIKGGFVVLTWDLLNSTAYKDLTPSAAKLLPYAMGKPKVHMNDPACYYTEFEFTYSEAKRLGFSNTTFRRCLDELVGKGFIKQAHKGGLRGDGFSSSKYLLSIAWQTYGTTGHKPLIRKQVIPNEQV